MIFIGGRRLLGKVKAYAGTCVVTEFLHFYYLPLLPIRSHVVLETNANGGIKRSLPIRVHGASALAGYLRTWSVVGAGFALLAATAAGGGRAAVGSGISCLVVAALHTNVAEGARGLMATGYRSSLDPARDWADVALDPTVHDDAFLQACLALARIDWSRAQGPARARLAEQHQRIWEKLKSLGPPPLGAGSTVREAAEGNRDPFV